MKVSKIKREVNGKTETIQTIYYNMREAGIEVGKSYQAILDYTKYSDKLELEGKERLIPKPVLIDKVKHFSQDEVEQIKDFIKTLKRGDLIQFTRDRNRYMEMKERNIELEAENTELRKTGMNLFKQLEECKNKGGS